MSMKALSQIIRTGDFSLRRIVSLSLSAALISVGFSAVVAPASHAAVTGEIRFVSMTDGSSQVADDGHGGSISGNDLGLYYQGICDWGSPMQDTCQTGGVWQYYPQYTNKWLGYATAGHTVTLRYKATSGWPSYSPIASQDVYLRVHPQYTTWDGAGDGGAALTIGGHSITTPTYGWAGSCGFNGNDCAVIHGTTDSNGYVEFVVQSDTLNGDAEARPNTLNSGTPGVASSTFHVSAKLMVSFGPALATPGVSSYGTDTADNQPQDNIGDLLTLHIMQEYVPGAFVPASETLTATSGLLGTYNDTNTSASFVSNGWYKSGVSYLSAYAYQGSAFSLTYHVVDSSTGTSAAAGTTVSLRINKTYSGSNAKFSVPSGVTSAGTGSGGDGKVLTGTTDSSGDVTFSLVNSDSYCESSNFPNDVNGLATGTGGIFSQIALMSGDPLQEVMSFIEIHFVKNPANEVQCTFPAHRADLVISQASIDVNGNDVTCKATPGSLPYEGERFFSEAGYPDGLFRSYSLPTQATYYLVYNGVPVWAKSTADVTDKNSEYADYIQTKSASLTSATFSIPKTWNENHSATVACRIKQSAALGAAGTSTSPAMILKASGKAKKVKSLEKTTNVTMRLVSGFLNKDKNGTPADYVDFSYDPIQNHWSQYYGPNLGVFYKYFKVGGSTTMTWNVTDAVTGAPYALKRVYLVVNKNYGGQENATFVRPGGGVVRPNPENWSLQETRIMGITDPAGNVTFTLKNTNSVSQAEPAPEALNKVQPTSVTPLFSTITLTAGLPETQETKDIIWGHITK